MFARNYVIWSVYAYTVCVCATTQRIRFLSCEIVPILIPNKTKWQLETIAEIRHGLNTIAFQNIYYVRNPIIQNVKMKWPIRIFFFPFLMCVRERLFLFSKWQFSNGLECEELRNKWIIIRCRRIMFFFLRLFFKQMASLSPHIECSICSKCWWWISFDQ